MRNKHISIMLRRRAINRKPRVVRSAVFGFPSMHGFRLTPDRFAVSAKLASWARVEAGFTLVELLVVISILALFYGLVMANFSAWRGPQYVKVAANELATNINKLHSYSLSARSLNNTPANYYIVQFNTGTTQTSYPIQAIAATTPNPTFISPVETIRFPGLVYVQELSYTDRSNVVTKPACVQVVFALPYGRTYIDPACSFNAGSTSKLLGELDNLANTKLSIVLARPGISNTKTVTVDAATGRVEIQ